jgi:hypothetical protein
MRCGAVRCGRVRWCVGTHGRNYRPSHAVLSIPASADTAANAAAVVGCPSRFHNKTSVGVRPSSTKHENEPNKTTTNQNNSENNKQQATRNNNIHNNNNNNNTKKQRVATRRTPCAWTTSPASSSAPTRTSSRSTSTRTSAAAVGGACVAVPACVCAWAYGFGFYGVFGACARACLCRAFVPPPYWRVSID